MTNDILQLQIQEIARRVFKQPGLVITDSTAAKDVDGWDSLTNIYLLLEIEKTFGVKIVAQDVVRLKNVLDLKDFIRAKTKPQ